MKPFYRKATRYFDCLAQQGSMRTFNALESTRLPGFLSLWRIRPGERILEPGCGSGRLSQVLQQMVGPAGRVVSFDLSAAMLACALKRCPPGLLLARCSVEMVPWPDRWFDQVICFHAFPHFHDPMRCLREIFRLLRPGGCLHITHSHDRESLNRLHRSLGPAVEKHLLIPVVQLATLLDQAGFELQYVFDAPAGFSLKALRPGG